VPTRSGPNSGIATGKVGCRDSALILTLEAIPQDGTTLQTGVGSEAIAGQQKPRLKNIAAHTPEGSYAAEHAGKTDPQLSLSHVGVVRVRQLLYEDRLIFPKFEPFYGNRGIGI
jgi:hypothetical protein